MSDQLYGYDMPPLPTKTDVHAQPRQVLPTAGVVRRGLSPASRAGPAVAQRSGRRRGPSRLVRRLAGALLLAIATVTLLLAVPPLRGVAHQISRMSLGWIAAALVLEIVSCAAYVVIFRFFFATVPARLARQVAWTEEGSGALLPGGGLGALAVGGWLLRRTGMSTRRIVESSSALFFLTSGINVAALVVGGVMLSSDAFGGHDTVILASAPIALGVGGTCLALAVPVVLHRGRHRRWPQWLLSVSAGIEGGPSFTRGAQLADARRPGLPRLRYRGPGRVVRRHRPPDPGRRARAWLPDRLSRQRAPRTGRVRRPGGGPGRHVDRLWRARDPGGRGGRRLPRDRVLGPEPRRGHRLRIPPSPSVIRAGAERRRDGGDRFHRRA